MKYCRVQTVHGAQYAEVVERAGELWVDRLILPFEEGPASDYVERAADTFDPLPLKEARTLVPVNPSKIICVGRNYREHAAELGNEVPAEPLLFLKAPSALLASGEAIRIPELSQRVDFEGEIAVVIGRKASQVKAKDAMKYVFGYTNFIDGSARGVVPPTNVFYQMKSRDTFAPVGPYIVTADEIKDPQKLQITLTNNGVVYQNFNTSDMAHKIPRCIEWVTSIHTLEPGDILATGTNHRGLNPFMDGDKIELTCEGCGTLHITVRDPLKRTWARITRLQHKESGGEGVHTKQTGGKYAPAK